MKKSNTRTLSRFLGLFLALALAVLALPLTPDAVAANYAPVAENMQFTTYRNVPLSGSLQAVDPEGDLLTFALASAPGKGEVSIASDGNFTYSPYAEKRAKTPLPIRLWMQLGTSLLRRKSPSKLKSRPPKSVMQI